MSIHLKRIAVKNYRCLADVCVMPGDITVLFGPNGAGKTTFLDAFWFVRDCAKRGVPESSSERSHGIGVLYEGALQDDVISISIENETSVYTVTFAFSSGRIEAYVGEQLDSRSDSRILIKRNAGSDAAKFYHYGTNNSVTFQLNEPDFPALKNYVFFQDRGEEASEMEKLLHFTHFHRAREVNLYGLKRYGSETSHQVFLWERCDNLWSVMRNLHDKRDFDDRYGVIMKYMRRAFPDFKGLQLEQTGPNSVYASIIDGKLKSPIQASGVSDGHLQLLIHLASLFSEGKHRSSILLLDEPETSLHPWAIAVLAEALKEASENWSKQIVISTHSPVLLSQFDLKDILAVTRGDSGQTLMRRLDQFEELQDLMKSYATGSLYMSGLIAPQGIDEENATPSLQ